LAHPAEKKLGNFQAKHLGIWTFSCSFRLASDVTFVTCR